MDKYHRLFERESSTTREDIRDIIIAFQQDYPHPASNPIDTDRDEPGEVAMRDEVIEGIQAAMAEQSRIIREIQECLKEGLANKDQPD